MKKIRVVFQGSIKVFGMAIPVKWTVDVPENQPTEVKVNAVNLKGTVTATVKDA